MKRHAHGVPLLSLLAVLALACLAACSSQDDAAPARPSAVAQKGSPYIVSIVDEPDTTDFQCTTIHYTVALNVFNRLVETEVSDDGTSSIVPSLASSWTVSDDGLTYTFKLRDDVTFSNGSPLTASDVRYTFERLLTHPDSCAQDLLSDVQGAEALRQGEASSLEGFRMLDDHRFQIDLVQPFSAFLSCLCMPSASILDEQSTEAAGDLFGKDPASTIGTGPFVFSEWRHGEGMLLTANPDAWEHTECAGVDLRFVYDPDTLGSLFEQGQLDIINMDDLGDLSDCFQHSATYQGQIRSTPHVGIDYIALNASARPLDDVRVRKALQLALNRQTMLDAVYNGSGRIENGILPQGLLGHNPSLEAIPFDPEEASRLLAEAGLADGFDLTISMRASSPQWQLQLMNIAADMWSDVGVRASIQILDEDEFMRQRTTGQLACYTASWAADYDDPDNFVYTFFGSSQNATYRSLCYGNEDVMARVREARAITDEGRRIEEYRDLERTIVQEDCAWIPLFSRDRHFLVSDRVDNFVCAWNGWFETSFKHMSIRDA